MKQRIIFISLAIVVGLFLGYLIFGGNSEGGEATKAGSEEIVDNHEGHDVQMWTCSMHPQIMQPEPGNCPICGMELIPADQDTGGLSPGQFKLTENAMALADIQTTLVGSSTGENGLMVLSGKIRENEEENAVQASYFAGRIEKLYVNTTGEQVSRGQMLATIYAPQLVAAQQELLTTASMKESQPQLYQAVRNKLKLWKISEGQINQIEASGKIRENFPVYATLSGTVSEKIVQEGDYVQQGQPLYKIANLNSVWAVFDAYENQLSQLKEGQEILIETNAYPEKEFEASIDFIDPVLTTATRTIRVRAVLKNTDDLLKPGMFVKGKVKGKKLVTETPLTIPASAVLWTGERSVVYIKSDPTESVFEMREVTLGNKVNEMYIVVSGLSEGEEVVTNGTFTVDAAAQLRGKRSMMNTVQKEATPIMEMKLSTAFQNDFIPVLNAYIKLKDAFVTSDPSKVRNEAREVLNSMNAVSTASLDEMGKSHISTIKRMLTAIIGNEDIENQREHFIILSENIIAIGGNMKALPETLYVQKCPMANSNKGASWLSFQSEIRNPYYGDAMLSCGSVIDTLKKN